MVKLDQKVEVKVTVTLNGEIGGTYTFHKGQRVFDAIVKTYPTFKRDQRNQHVTIGDLTGILTYKVNGNPSSHVRPGLFNFVSGKYVIDLELQPIPEVADRRDAILVTSVA